LDFNGSEITEMRKLPRLVAETKVNTNSKITVWRSEKKKSLKVVIAEMQEEKKQIEKTQNETKPNNLQSDYIKELGLTLGILTKDIRMSQNIPDNVLGLLVTKVDQEYFGSF
jgi:serine protease Do